MKYLFKHVFNFNLKFWEAKNSFPKLFIGIYTFFILFISCKQESIDERYIEKFQFPTVGKFDLISGVIKKNIYPFSDSLMFVLNKRSHIIYYYDGKNWIEHFIPQKNVNIYDRLMDICYNKGRYYFLHDSYIDVLDSEFLILDKIQYNIDQNNELIGNTGNSNFEVLEESAYLTRLLNLNLNSEIDRHKYFNSKLIIEIIINKGRMSNIVPIEFPTIYKKQFFSSSYPIYNILPKNRLVFTFEYWDSIGIYNSNDGIEQFSIPKHFSVEANPFKFNGIVKKSELNEYKIKNASNSFILNSDDFIILFQTLPYKEITNENGELLSMTTKDKRIIFFDKNLEKFLNESYILPKNCILNLSVMFNNKLYVFSQSKVNYATLYECELH